jgi:hypothetical protein
MPNPKETAEQELERLQAALAENNAIIQDATKYLKKNQRTLGGYCRFKQPLAVKETTARKAQAIAANAKLNADIERLTAPADTHMLSKYESQKATWETERDALREQQEKVKALKKRIERSQVELDEQQRQQQQLEHIGNLANGIVTAAGENKLSVNQTIFSLLSEEVKISVDGTGSIDALQKKALQLGEARQTVENLSHRSFGMKLFMMVLAFLSRSKTSEEKANEQWLKEKSGYNKALNKAVKTHQQAIQKTEGTITDLCEELHAVVAEKDEYTGAYELKEVEALLTFPEAEAIETLKEQCEHDGEKNPVNHLKTALLHFLNQRTQRAFNALSKTLNDEPAALHDEALYTLLHEVSGIYPALNALLHAEETHAADNQSQIELLSAQIGKLRAEEAELDLLIEATSDKYTDTQAQLEQNTEALLTACFLAFGMKKILAETETTEEELVAGNHLLELIEAKINDISENHTDNISQAYKAIFDMPNVERYDMQLVILALCYQSNLIVFCEQFGKPDKKGILEHLKTLKEISEDSIWNEKREAVVPSDTYLRRVYVQQAATLILSITYLTGEVMRNRQIWVKIDAALNQFEAEIDKKTSEERVALYALYNGLIEKHPGIVSSNMQMYKQAAIEIAYEISITRPLHEAFSEFDGYDALKAVTDALPEAEQQNKKLNEALPHQSLTTEALAEQPALMKKMEAAQSRRDEIHQTLRPLEREQIALQQGQVTATPAEKTHQLIRACETASTDKHLKVHKALKAFLSNPTKILLKNIKKAIQTDKACLDTPETKRLIERTGEVHPEVLQVMHHALTHQKPSTYFGAKLGYFSTSGDHTPDAGNDNSLEPKK